MDLSTGEEKRDIRQHRQPRSVPLIFPRSYRRGRDDARLLFFPGNRLRNCFFFSQRKLTRRGRNARLCQSSLVSQGIESRFIGMEFYHLDV